MVKEFIYPFIIRYEDGVYYANSTDIDECFTDGDSIQEVISNIDDVLEAMVSYYIEENKTLPQPNFEIETKGKIYISKIKIDIDKLKNKSIKKTLSIPKWINDEAMEKGVNFSKILQDALIEYLK